MNWWHIPPVYIDPQGRFVKNQTKEIKTENPNVLAVKIHGFSSNFKSETNEDELDDEKC